MLQVTVLICLQAATVMVAPTNRAECFLAARLRVEQRFKIRFVDQVPLSETPDSTSLFERSNDVEVQILSIERRSGVPASKRKGRWLEKTTTLHGVIQLEMERTFPERTLWIRMTFPGSEVEWPPPHRLYQRAWRISGELRRQLESLGCGTMSSDDA